MKRMKAFDFEVVNLTGPPRIVCKFLTKNNDSITIYGDTVDEIFDKCRTQFPEGINTTGIVFSGANISEAKNYFFSLVSLGLKNGYFKEEDFDK